MQLKAFSSSRVRVVVPLMVLAAAAAACSSSPSHSSSLTHTTSSGPIAVPVTVPANCKISTTQSPTAHAFIGIKATGKAGVTAKQLATAMGIPNSKTMPCASGATYTPGGQVAVGVYFLNGASAADQATSAATLRASGLFSDVTVQPQG